MGLKSHDYDCQVAASLKECYRCVIAPAYIVLVLLFLKRVV